jgi:hypothetical protein
VKEIESLPETYKHSPQPGVVLEADVVLYHKRTVRKVRYSQIIG